MPILHVSKSHHLHGFTLLPCSSVGIVLRSAYDLVLALICSENGQRRDMTKLKISDIQSEKPVNYEAAGCCSSRTNCTLRCLHASLLADDEQRETPDASE
jgi:hypothetical protein